MTLNRHLNTMLIPLRWMDLDAYAHVGNARFYDYMSDARVEALGKANILEDASKQYVVVESACSFKKPVFYPGMLVLEQYCSYVKNASFRLEYQFFTEDAPDILCAEGHVVMACYDVRCQKAVRLPEDVRKRLS